MVFENQLHMIKRISDESSCALGGADLVDMDINNVEVRKRREREKFNFMVYF